MTVTVDALLARTVQALDDLGATAAPIDDEWQYVTDLGAAWGARVRAVGASRAGETADPAVAAAVERAVAESALVTDPHRAIDWLSTLPQIVLVALGESS